MSTDHSLERSYANPMIARGYDALSWLIYRPIGGLDALREQALDAIGVTSARAVRVLELGCGTGGLTRKLLARGASVTSVDWSEPMLRVARGRAPGATFVRSEITAYEPAAQLDLVLLAFVLHELSPEARSRALDVARRALAPGGAVAVVDHAEPAEGLLPKAIFRFVAGFEPTSMPDWARGGFEGELLRAGLRPVKQQRLARGTAQVMVAQVS